MLIDWIGGWASHSLAAYIGMVVGILFGVALTWQDEQKRKDGQGSTTPEGGPHA